VIISFSRLCLLTFIVLIISPIIGSTYDLVPDTGQSKCYDDTREIPCPNLGDPFFGQDGNYQGSQPSYQLSADSLIVTDLNTGLMWQQADDGIPKDWASAISYCENLEFGGYADWRLPSLQELISIVDYGRFYWSINPIFSISNSSYWTSNPVADGSNAAWHVVFVHGNTGLDLKDSYPGAYARCVRGTITQSIYVDNGDGSITDTATNLVWQQTPYISKNWQDALSYCQNLELAGQTDWRLPNIRELQSIIDSSQYNPAMNPAFNCLASQFWSSTTHSYNLYKNYAWYVNFAYGDTDFTYKTGGSYTLCVRRFSDECKFDFDNDGDIDGLDIIKFINTEGCPDIQKFAAEFGKSYNSQ
jgi:hypothetical protein